jgi:polynucleotide 5'-kinase involved in rRNA processing
MLQVLTGAARLVAGGFEAGAQAIVYDTTGLLDPAQGGINLKMAKIDLLRPEVLFAIQQDRELEPLLKPLRHSRRVQVLNLPSSPASRNRDIPLRRAYRARKFADYFADAHFLRVEWPRFAVFPAPRFDQKRLVAMEDAKGFTIGLGIVQEFDRSSKTVLFLTPLSSMESVDAIRLGDAMVDPETFEDRSLPGPE